MNDYSIEADDHTAAFSGLINQAAIINPADIFKIIRKSLNTKIAFFILGIAVLPLPETGHVLNYAY